MHEGEPATLLKSAAHERHAPLEVLPELGLYVPAGQGVAAPAPAGQKEPLGHATCVAEHDPVGQKEPAVQGPSHVKAVREEVARP